MKINLTAVEIVDLKLILDREIDSAFEFQAKFIKSTGKYSKAAEMRVATAKKLLAKIG